MSEMPSWMVETSSSIKLKPEWLERIEALELRVKELERKTTTRELTRAVARGMLVTGARE